MPFVSSTLKSLEKWRTPLSGATGSLNHQILPYGILFLTFMCINFTLFAQGELKIMNGNQRIFFGGQIKGQQIM
jgi:hypothetical protein